MKIFILDVAELTSSYHSSGGLVVVAKDLEAARAAVEAHTPEYGSVHQPTDAEWAAATVYELRGSGHDPKIFVFPDAGCC